MRANLTARLGERAKAFKDAGLTYGVADLLTEAQTELARVEQALEREGLSEVLMAAIDALPHHKRLYPELYANDLADAIRSLALGGPTNENSETNETT